MIKSKIKLVNQYYLTEIPVKLMIDVSFDFTSNRKLTSFECKQLVNYCTKFIRSSLNGDHVVSNEGKTRSLPLLFFELEPYTFYTRSTASIELITKAVRGLFRTINGMWESRHSALDNNFLIFLEIDGLISIQVHYLMYQVLV